MFPLSAFRQVGSVLCNSEFIKRDYTQDAIGVNLYKAPRPEPPPPLFKVQGSPCFWAPTYCQIQYIFAYYEAVFHSVTNNKMKLNDIHATFIWIEQ